MANTPKTIADLMCELSIALAELSEKMSNLAIDLENQYLGADGSEPMALIEATRSTIDKAKSG